MNEMQPVVLEKARFSEKNRKFLHFSVNSVMNISYVRNVSQIIVFDWFSAIANLIVKTSVWKIQLIVFAKIEF